jgi:hypothetical protein
VPSNGSAVSFSGFHCALNCHEPLKYCRVSSTSPPTTFTRSSALRSSNVPLGKEIWAWATLDAKATATAIPRNRPNFTRGMSIPFT